MYDSKTTNSYNKPQTRLNKTQTLPWEKRL